MTQEERYKITSNEYIELLIEYFRNQKLLNKYEGASVNFITDRYAVVYMPANILGKDFIREYGYAVLPRCYGLESTRSIEVSGIAKLRRLPNYNLRGQGVLVAIIDTGIDYTNPIFIREDGTSKIVSLWDQTIDSETNYPKESFYGTEYSRDQINEALKAKEPLTVVPSKDEIGHGTMLAGIAVGNENQDNNFAGIVPDADLIIIKLKQAKQVIKEFLEIHSDVPCYQENDILQGVVYCGNIARKLGRPISFCIGVGTSQGSHDGSGILANLISVGGDFPGWSVSVAAGNEGNLGRHFYGEIDPAVGYSTVELLVGKDEKGFTMELWGTIPNTYSIDIFSPAGEFIPRIQESIRINQEVSFIFEKTVIEIDYILLETHARNQLILMRFHAPTPGIWRFRVYSRGDLKGTFHIWLPMNGFITKDTVFLQADPYTTINSPGNAITPITVTAYNPDNYSLYLQASKGYSRINKVKPELAAPGDGIIVPTLDKKFAASSGTSLAAAHTAGIAAMILEWGIVKGNYPGIDSVDIKKYLIRGAKRDKSSKYPNKDWGYGMIDLYNTYDVLRRDFPIRR